MFYFTFNVHLRALCYIHKFFVLFINDILIHHSYVDLLILPSIISLILYLHNLSFVLHLMVIYKFYIKSTCLKFHLHN